MQFRGLFVGIDRYASPGIKWLSCAARDAIALHAIFGDTLGEGGELLVDEQATRAAITEAVDRLAASQPDDVVVIAFSGHGSETHELVTYDADGLNLAATAIPLDTLGAWLDRIPARQVILLLDCCFSGGMGAKVLQVASAPRSMGSATQALNQLSGDGRLIVTASTATQEAWENTPLRHGLFTYYLLEALQGAEEVRQAGKVSIYRLIEYVSRRVTDAAARLNKMQQPTIRGRIDGELMWPIFRPGPCYRAAFPERSRAPVTAAIASLAPHGFPPTVLDAWAGVIPSFNALQRDAINDFGLLGGAHLVVSAPTSSGKTMIGELAALKGVLERRRALFLLPLKALVNDKHQQFTRTYGPFGLRVILATGEIADDIPALMRGQYDVCLMTYEKCAALVLGNPYLLDQIGTIVVDEVQMIADPSRGANLEFLLTALRARRAGSAGPQLIALSAVIGDTNGLERWLDARLLRRTERPVPLNEGVLRADGNFRYLDPGGVEQVEPCIRREGHKDSNQDWVIPLVRKLVGKGEQVIVFRETKGETVRVAQYLARALALPPAQAALDALPGGDPSGASSALRAVLANGVAFHNADLDREERRAVEEGFRAQGATIRVIVATTTLAMGVNTPAEAVIIVGLEHPGPQPYTVAEYKNIVGRAGRLGLSQRGTSYLLALTPKEEHDAWTGYVRNAPEDLRSRFLAEGTDPRSLVVKVLAAAARTGGQGLDPEDVIAFLEGSFGSFQQRQANGRWAWDRESLMRALDNLETHGLVERAAEGCYVLTPLGRAATEGGVEVETVTRLVDALRPLDPAATKDATLVTLAQLAVEFDDFPFPYNKRSTAKEPQEWPRQLARQGVPATLLQQLHRAVRDEHTATLRAKRAVACLLWMTDQPLATIERALTQFMGASDAAGPIRAVRARTGDVLPAVIRVASLLHPSLDLALRQERLLVQLELGLPPAAVDLALLAGDKLARADYLRLLRVGLCTVDAIERREDDVLLGCVDGSREKLRVLHRAVRDAHEREGGEISLDALLPISGG